MYRGEKGVQIITPLYTHLDKNGKECGILVNRGWVPLDLQGYRLHYANDSTNVVGVLYKGDNPTKYSRPNDPTNQTYYNVTPYDFALIDQLANEEEASQFMLRMFDEDEDARQVLPTIPTKKEFMTWGVSPERHEAYENMWRALAFTGVLANAAVWLSL